MDQSSLLRWGIENSAPGAIKQLASDVKSGKRTDLNSAMLKHIMGVSPADRMVECVDVIQGRWKDAETGADRSSEVTIEDKLRAWDDLEMLIEDLDNANDLKFLKLWTPILEHLADEVDEVRMRACWVCGTAVQNNPRAQDNFLELDPLPIINSLVVSSTSSAATRSKAMYCLSSTLKHSPAAMMRFNELDGWKILNQSLRDPSVTLRTKTAFLLSSLVLQSDSPDALVASIRASSTLATLITSLTSASLPTGPNGEVEALDADYKEKALRVLVNIVAQTTSGLLAQEKQTILGIVKLFEQEGLDLEEVGLAKDEWEEFKTKLAA